MSTRLNYYWTLPLVVGFAYLVHQAYFSSQSIKKGERVSFTRGLLKTGDFAPLAGLVTHSRVVVVDAQTAWNLKNGDVAAANQHTVLVVDQATAMAEFKSSGLFTINAGTVTSLGETIDFDRCYLFQAFPFVEHYDPYSGSICFRVDRDKVVGIGGMDRPKLGLPMYLDSIVGRLGDKWFRLGSLGFGLCDAGCSVLKSGRVLIAGGQAKLRLPNQLADMKRDGIWIFDPRSRSMIEAGSLQIDRASPSMIRLDDGSVLIAGGISFGQHYPVMSRCELWTEASQRTRLGHNLAVERFDHDCVLLNDGRALLIGGKVSPFHADEFDEHSLELYNPKEDK